MTPAHRQGALSELVCSNSLRAKKLENAVGLLKEEMRILDSLIIKSADLNQVPAGGALAVDRDAFSSYITERISHHPNIDLIRDEMTTIPDEGFVIIATGPLSSPAISRSIQDLVKQEYLYFFDAAAPIVASESLDHRKLFKASRYGRGEDYLNSPMSENEYDQFWEALINAECVQLKPFEDYKVFEGCMPIEVMAKRGRDTLRFGPLKPVGLTNPQTGKEPFAVVQLRQDNRQASLYNLVGFQTNLKFGEQKRILSLIPGLEQAHIVRYGVMHRNTYICSPKLLNACYQLLEDPRIFFAGQITGVEGYVESASSGLVAGLNMSLILHGKDPINFPDSTAIGALAQYISDPNIKNFQPMNINFGIMASPKERIYNKKEKNRKIAETSLKIVEDIVTTFKE